MRDDSTKPSLPERPSHYLVARSLQQIPRSGIDGHHERAYLLETHPRLVSVAGVPAAESTCNPALRVTSPPPPCLT